MSTYITFFIEYRVGIYKTKDSERELWVSADNFELKHHFHYYYDILPAHEEWYRGSGKVFYDIFIGMENSVKETYPEYFFIDLPMNADARLLNYFQEYSSLYNILGIIPLDKLLEYSWERTSQLDEENETFYKEWGENFKNILLSIQDHYKFKPEDIRIYIDIDY